VSKTPIFFAKFFPRNILQIITSVPVAIETDAVTSANAEHSFFPLSDLTVTKIRGQNFLFETKVVLLQLADGSSMPSIPFLSQLVGVEPINFENCLAKIVHTYIFYNLT
jgi:hypothetical protein